MKLRLKNILFFLLLVPFLLCSEQRTEQLIFGVPAKCDLLIHKQGFTIGYSQKYKQALWVGYVLRAEDLTGPQVRRKNRFRKDPAVKINPVLPSDYSQSGFDRGHLAPAADMTYSILTEQESFFMTNMSPQVPGCNRGIWKRVEKQVRKWAIREERLCIVTGPIFLEDYQKMGKAEIAIPVAFYKVILDLTPPRKMIAFIVPNQASRRRIQSFVVSVQTVEQLTGYLFFSTLQDPAKDPMKTYSNLSVWE